MGEVVTMLNIKDSILLGCHTVSIGKYLSMFQKSKLLGLLHLEDGGNMLI